jgi:hypothetical protein
MVQPPESILTKDATERQRTISAVRCPLLKSEMRAVLMVVTTSHPRCSLQSSPSSAANVLAAIRLLVKKLYDLVGRVGRFTAFSKS